jgi:hypothetical protein
MDSSITLQRSHVKLRPFLPLLVLHIIVEMTVPNKLGVWDSWVNEFKYFNFNF